MSKVCHGKNDSIYIIMTKKNGTSVIPSSSHTHQINPYTNIKHASASAKDRSGSKNTHRHTDSLSESDFCIAVARNEENDVFPLLEADLDIQEKERKPVAEKLAKVARSRFSVKLSENKLKEKLDSHMIPETCTEIRATFKIKNYHSGGQRPHPYKRGQNRPIIDQTPLQYRQRGSYSSLWGRGKPWNQRGVGKFWGEITDSKKSER